jgi:hypothetical protein
VSLRDEVAADQDPRMGKCKLCAWLESLAPAIQKEWDDVLSDGSFSHSSIERTMQRHKVPVGRTAMEKHRKKRHRDEPGK